MFMLYLECSVKAYHKPLPYGWFPMEFEKKIILDYLKFVHGPVSSQCSKGFLLFSGSIKWKNWQKWVKTFWAQSNADYIIQKQPFRDVLIWCSDNPLKIFPNP